MKLNELISNFTIYVSKQESEFLESFNGPRSLEQFNPNELFLLQRLVQKSLIKKNEHGKFLKQDNV